MLKRKCNKKIVMTLKKQDLFSVLELFEYKDALTGLPLGSDMANICFLNIIPLVEGGDMIRENIIPCSKNMGLKFKDKNLLEEYRNNQDIYNKERYDRILRHMGNYKKMLFVPKSQRQYIGDILNGSIYRYSIVLPNYSIKRLFFSSSTTIEQRICQLEREVLEPYRDYCESNWLHNGKTDPYNMNDEDRTKLFLSSCSGYLTYRVGKDLDRIKILKKNEINKINNNEVALSSTASNVQAFLYGESEDKEYSYSDCYITVPAPKGKNDKHNGKSWKDTNFHKYNKIIGKYFSGSQKAQWCKVDVRNKFYFKGIEYTILEDEKQYRKRECRRFEDFRNDYKMDRILVVQEKDKRIFLDQNMNIVNKIK